jgi:hypothetical protein
MVLHAVHTESSLKELGDAAMFKLTGLHCEQICTWEWRAENPHCAVQPEPQGGAASSNFFVPRLSDSIFMTVDPVSVNGTLQHATVNAAKYVMKLANHRRMALLFAKDGLESWFCRSNIEKRLIHIELINGRAAMLLDSRPCVSRIQLVSACSWARPRRAALQSGASTNGEK